MKSLSVRKAQDNSQENNILMPKILTKRAPVSEHQTPSISVENELAEKILGILHPFKRVTGKHSNCESDCKACNHAHLRKIASAIRSKKPITFVLPAFPGKSPNPNKVLGSMPDMAEQLSLVFLNEVCQKIRTLYCPGAKIVICSDGRVFSDIVGMKEVDVSEYQNQMESLIKKLNLSHLNTFNLETLFSNSSYGEARSILMRNYGLPLETLKKRTKQGGSGSEDPLDKEAHRMFCGITRFLFEDSMTPGQQKSRTALQKEARVRAYEVIRRSNAWSLFIEHEFPEAVRLSIHPQECGSSKIGIQLLGEKQWLTPWHGVAVKVGQTFTLMKKSEVDQSRFELAYDSNANPIYFKQRDTSRRESQ